MARHEVKSHANTLTSLLVDLFTTQSLPPMKDEPLSLQIGPTQTTVTTTGLAADDRQLALYLMNGADYTRLIDALAATIDNHFEGQSPSVKAALLRRYNLQYILTKAQYLTIERLGQKQTDGTTKVQIDAAALPTVKASFTEAAESLIRSTLVAHKPACRSWRTIAAYLVVLVVLVVLLYVAARHRPRAKKSVTFDTRPTSVLEFS